MGHGRPGSESTDAGLTLHCKPVTCTCVPGRASAKSVLPLVDSTSRPGAVEVRVPGEASEVIANVRMPTFSPEDVAKAEASMARRAGPIVARVRAQAEEHWGAIRGDLNREAGGQASPRVAVLAHHALRAHTALELQSLLAEVAAGEGADGSDKHFRSTAGLAVVATDLLNKAYEAAREEGQARRGSATDRLFDRIGVGQKIPGDNVGVGGGALGAVAPGSDLTPVSPPGGDAVGAPLSSNPSSETPSSPKDSE